MSISPPSRASMVVSLVAARSTGSVIAVHTVSTGYGNLRSKVSTA